MKGGSGESGAHGEERDCGVEAGKGCRKAKWWNSAGFNGESLTRRWVWQGWREEDDLAQGQ